MTHSARVRYPGQGESPSLEEMEIARRCHELEEAIKEDLAAKSQELKEQGGNAFWPAFDVNFFLAEIIEPIDKFGNFVACILNDDPGSAEKIGLALLLMADGMRFRHQEFEKKMEVLDMVVLPKGRGSR